MNANIVKSALRAVGVGVFALYAGSVWGTVIAEVEPNDTAATAQNVNGSFSLDFSANIGNGSGANTSTSIPHVTIRGTGNGTLDYYSFASLGGTIIIDIDFGHTTTGVSGSTDTELAIWNAAGIVLFHNDDLSTVAGAGGSVSSLDAFIQLDGQAAGTYTVGVCEFNCDSGNGFSMSGNLLDAGDTYTLQISTVNVPEPTTLLLLGLGLAGLGFTVKRIHD